MAKEAIEAVKKAEEEANNFLQSASQASRDLKKEAELLAEEKYKTIMEEADKEAKILRDRALQEGEEISKPVIEKGLEEAEKILAIKDEELKSAVNIIIERIVNVNGNS